MIKSYTDISQSKKLAEILPLESADMYWWSSGKRCYIEAMDDGDFNEEEGHVRAWSLVALLNVLPESIDNNTDDFSQLEIYKNHVCYAYANGNVRIGIRKDNLIDACYEMIIKLHELKML